MRKLCLILSALALLAPRVQAQKEPPATPLAELSTGWSYFRVGQNGTDDANLKGGWTASLGVNLNRWAGVIGEFSGHYGEQLVPVTVPLGGVRKLEADTRLHTFLFGPRLFYRTERWSPYVHTLFGVARIHHGGKHFVGGSVNIDRTETPFAMAVGGGLDMTLGRGWSYRGQVDYLLTRPEELNVNNLRVSTGLNFRFGRK